MTNDFFGRNHWKIPEFNLRGLARTLDSDAKAIERLNGGMAATMRGAAEALRLAAKELQPTTKLADHQPVKQVSTDE